jgi:hypothetical protein
MISHLIPMKIRLQAILACCLSCFVWASGSSAAAEQLAQASGLFGGDESSSMQIDLKPGDEENVMTARSGRVIPVGLMGSASLDVDSINPRTIRLQGVGVMLVGKSDKSLCRKTDLNADGHLDLLCDVRTTGFRVGEGVYTIVIKAETYNKAYLRGEDKLKIVP